MGYKLPDRDTLVHLYWEQEVLVPEIADMYGVGQSAVWAAFKRHNIELRDKHETARIALERYGRKIWGHGRPSKDA